MYKARLAFFHVHYTTLLHLPPIRFHCIEGELIRIICSSSTSLTRQCASAGPRPLLSRAGSGDDRGRSSSYFLILILIFKIISNHSRANPKHNDFKVRNSFNKRAMKIFCLAVVQLKTQNRKFETNIPRKGIARPQSQFPHSCVCERFIYSQDRSAYSAAGKYVD